MKKICYLFLVFALNSCKAQNLKVLDMKRKDLFSFSFTEKNINHIPTSQTKEIYRNGSTIIISRDWVNIGKEYFKKEFLFTKELDTMKISCICGQEKNIFITNLNFKKGDLKIRLSKDNNIKEAKILFNNEKLKNQEVINLYNKKRKGQDDTFMNSSFGKIKFYIINYRANE